MMSQVTYCSSLQIRQRVGAFLNAKTNCAVPSRAKHIPRSAKRRPADVDKSNTDPGKLTDIRHYQMLDKSHLHVWDPRSPKRKFLLKLEEMEKKQFFTHNQTRPDMSATPNPELDPSNQLGLGKPDNLQSVQNESNTITLPLYIKRSPSTILRALASCVTRDKTAPDYKYHDDPYLIPYSSVQKRDYILSKDGGRRAARFVLDQHPELFEKNLIYDEPKIKHYLPKIQIKGKEQNTDLLKELLVQYIHSFHVLGAIEVYELLEKTSKGKRVLDDSIKQELLELLCYHNNEEEMDQESHQMLDGMYVEDRSSIWSHEGLAERLYTDIVTSSPQESSKDEDLASRARLALLCGVGKFGRQTERKSKGGLERVLQLREECKVNGTQLNLEAYNSVLRNIPYIATDFEKGSALLTEILKEMETAGIHPNEETLNNAMLFLNNLAANNIASSHASAQKTALSLLSEFRNIGVEPCLATYGNLLEIYNLSKTRNQILIDIIAELERKQKSGAAIRAVIPEDFKFLREAMFACTITSTNLNLAYRIHRVAINEGDYGIALLGDYQNLNNYYKMFMMNVLWNEPIDVAMDLYTSLVPHRWSPVIRFYGDLVKEVQAQGAHQHLPKIWTDLQASNFCAVSVDGRMAFCETFASAMTSADLITYSDDDAEMEERNNILKTFVLIGRDIFDDIVRTADYRQYPLARNTHAIPICNAVLGLAIKKGEGDEVADFVCVKKVIDFCRHRITTLVGTLNSGVLINIMEVASTELSSPGRRETALNCVMYAAENRDPDALKMAKILLENIHDLNEIEKVQLNQLFFHETEWTNLT